MLPPSIFHGSWAWLPKKMLEHIRKNEDKKLLYILLQLTFDCYTTYTAYVLNTICLHVQERKLKKCQQNLSK